MTDTHPGGFEVKYWFDSTDNLWHAKVSTYEFTGATLEAALKAVQPTLDFLGGILGWDACFAVAIGDKS